MEKRYYSAKSLERSLELLERRYDMPSNKFYALASTAGKVEGVPSFARSVWASLYRDFIKLRGSDDFAESVERALELV